MWIKLSDLEYSFYEEPYKVYLKEEMFSYTCHKEQIFFKVICFFKTVGDNTQLFYSYLQVLISYWYFSKNSGRCNYQAEMYLFTFLEGEEASGQCPPTSLREGVTSCFLDLVHTKPGWSDEHLWDGVELAHQCGKFKWLTPCEIPALH